MVSPSEWPKCLINGVANYLLTGMILQVGSFCWREFRRLRFAVLMRLDPWMQL